MKRITVWRKELTNKDGKKFPIYKCKDDNNNFYNVKLSEDCKKELPSTKIFVVVVDERNISISTKRKTSKETGETYTENFVYLHNDFTIEPFEQPECDIAFK